MSVAIIGMGLPGSGKTSGLKTIACNLTAEYLSTNEIRDQSSRHPSVKWDTDGIWRIVHARACRALLLNKNVVIDSTHIKRNHRLATIRSCSFADQIILVWYKTPIEICIDSSKRSYHPVPSRIIERMDEILQDQPPSITEGYSQIEIIEYTTSI